MRALILTLMFSPIVLLAQPPQQPPSTSPLAGIFPEQQGPPANYLGYAFIQCGPANAPGLRIVALQGLIPEGIPKAPPRPSIELVIPGTVETAIGKQFTVVPKPSAESAVAFSCPVVGDCAPAENGALVVTSRTGSGALVGEFKAKWGIGAVRAGRFTAAWRESQEKCS